MADELKPSPRNALLGLLADALQGASDYAAKKDYQGGLLNPPLNMLSGLLGVPGAARTVNQLSYGAPITNIGKGSYKPMIPQDTVDAVNLLAMATPAVSRGALKASDAAVRAITGNRQANAVNVLAQAAQMNRYAPRMAPELPWVVGQDGAPRKFYHGTAGDHMELSDSYAGSVSSGAGQGHWFAYDPQYAWEYAENAAGKRGLDPRLATANLRAGKTLRVEFNGRGEPIIDGKVSDFENNLQIIKHAKANGYDSIDFPMGSFTDEPSFVVLRADQAKLLD